MASRGIIWRLHDKYRDSGLWPLLFSMKFDLMVKGVGLYGDFGRYVFQSALEDFVNVDISNIYYYAMQFILNDLGYNAEWFAEYDQQRSGYDRHHVKRVERIGKNINGLLCIIFWREYQIRTM